MPFSTFGHDPGIVTGYKPDKQMLAQHSPAMGNGSDAPIMRRQTVTGKPRAEKSCPRLGEKSRPANPGHSLSRTVPPSRSLSGECAPLADTAQESTLGGRDQTAKRPSSPRPCAGAHRARHAACALIGGPRHKAGVTMMGVAFLAKLGNTQAPEGPHESTQEGSQSA